MLLPFHIPGNAMTSVELAHVATLLRVPGSSSLLPCFADFVVRIATGPTYDPELAQQASALSAQIRKAIFDNAVVTYAGKPIFAYEVDGFGSVALQGTTSIRARARFVLALYAFNLRVFSRR